MRGYIDFVTTAGVAKGWCWDENRPDDRVTAIVAVDGVDVGRAIANLYREDLEKAGMGDGRHAFEHALPLDRLEAARSHTVTIKDEATGVIIGSEYHYQTQHMFAFDDRLSALETRAALLEGRVKELGGGQVSDATAAELFAIVGAFFERLARDVAHGEPVKPEQRLGDSIRTLAKTHPPIILSTKQNPTLSIVVEAEHPFGQIYDCVKAIKKAISRVDARLTVLDTGEFEEVALLPSLVRGVRYIRTANDLVTEWKEAVHDENSPFLMFLSGRALVDEQFLDAAMDWFDAHPRAGAVGGCEPNSDGTLRHAGLCLMDGKLEDCSRAGHPDKRVDMTICHPAHALSHLAAVVRRTAFQAVGGLDPVFGDDLGAAVIDLCFRLREAGWSVVSEPRAKVELPGRDPKTWASPALSNPSPIGDLLYQRWFDPANALPPALFVGAAAILAQAGQLRDEIEAVRSLREAGFAVVYLGEKESSRELEAVRNAGASILHSSGEDAETAPALVFVASNEDDPAPALPGKLKKTKIVAGLAELKRFLRFSATPFEARS